MRVFFRRETFLFGFILLLLAAVAFLLLSLIGGEIRTGALLAEYQAERAAFALFEVYRAGGQELEARLRRDEAILGFGVYDPVGQSLFLYGSAPPRIDPGRIRPQVPYFLREERAGRLTLIRPAGMLPEAGLGAGRPGRMRGMMMGRLPAFGRLIYLQVSLQELYAGGRRLEAARILVPAALAAVIAFFFYLYRLNLGYQKRIEGHERLVRLGEAARTLAHEIRNPLGAIRIQAAYLKRVLPEAHRGELQVIDEEIQRLDLLVNRISDFLRDPKGNPEPVDLDAFTRRLISRFGGEIRFENADGGPVRVSFDPDRLRSVLENLVANARESMEDGKAGEAGGEGEPGGGAAGGGGRAVEIRLQRHHGRAVLSILDRGKGLPPGRREELFDPFFTTKTRGSGIGLSLSRRFVEEAGGRIELLPRSGGGTEARVTLKELLRESGEP